MKRFQYRYFTTARASRGSIRKSYNSIPYDYRMSQMWVEGTLGIVPTLAPKIMLNEEGENITLSNNLDMFKKWADIWEKEIPCELILGHI